MNIDFLYGIKEVIVDGNSFLWIPKFYVDATPPIAGKFENNEVSTVSGHCIIHSDPSIKGKVHPAFIDSNGKEREGFYVSTYDIGELGSDMVSRSGVLSVKVKSKSQASQIASTLVDGGQIMSYWQYQALLLCYFLTNGNQPAQPYSTPPEEQCSCAMSTTVTSTSPSFNWGDVLLHLKVNPPKQYTTGGWHKKISPTVDIYDFGSGFMEMLKEDVKVQYVFNPSTKKAESVNKPNANNGTKAYGITVYSGFDFPAFTIAEGTTKSLVRDGFYIYGAGTPILSVAGTFPFPAISGSKQSNNKYNAVIMNHTFYRSPLNMVEQPSECALRVCTYEPLK